MSIVHRHHLSGTVSTACSPGGAESWFMLTGLLKLYKGWRWWGMWGTDNPLLRSNEDQKGLFGLKSGFASSLKAYHMRAEI